MADYIDRQALLEWFKNWSDYDEFSVGYITRVIEDEPPAEAVRVVRCKDCKHWMPYDWMFSEVWRSVSKDDYSDDEIGCAYCDMNMHANDFCSRAERKNDE